MIFSSPIKRKKIEIKPVKLSYYNHSSDQRNVFSPVSRKYRNSIKIVFAFLIVGAFIPLIYYFFTKYKIFQITEIEVYGSNNYVPLSEVRGYIENKSLGKSIIKTEPSSFVQELKKEFLGMESVIVSKKFPNKLIVNVSERIPVAVIVHNDQKFLVDKDGYVMQQLTDPAAKYSEIIYSEEVYEGQFINQNIVPMSVELIKHAQDSNLVINKMQFTSQYITLDINDNIEVDLSLAEDNAIAMKQIAAIVQKTSSEGQKLRKVDLRFEKVIVLYD